jgi:sulfur-carrier protein adenylyltransferase/sulfurtransferase
MGGRSRAAAQLLAGKGFKEVYNLKGGIKAWQGLTAAGPAEMGMILLSGDETASDIIMIAYAMEHGLEGFYSAVSGMTNDPEVTNVLTKLAKIEENHKQRLFNLYRTLDPDVGDKETFEANISSDSMEGGFTTEEFLEQNSTIMDTVAGVLNIAMMLETQALDLYLRYSQKAKNEESKTVLYDIAEEEKSHLATLGRLIEAKA